ncbi:MAG: 50S ribosomal protein L14 [Candidatus Berkelbacteria bacterium]|jgi:large subunit ribosomal protein L14|nr:50S ribosomal protein L14 [Candidatus Berkelbacteria bacterium]
MVQAGTIMNVADNSGAKRIRVITVLGDSRRRYARIGGLVSASTIEATPGGGVKKKEVVHALVLRTRKETRMDDGTYLRFSDNAAVILDEGNNIKGTRIFGPVPRVLKKFGFNKIVSLAREVV